MNDNEKIVLTPKEAQKLNHEGWVLKLLDKVERPSKEPRRYFVIGKQRKSSSKGENTH